MVITQTKLNIKDISVHVVTQESYWQAGEAETGPQSRLAKSTTQFASREAIFSEIKIFKTLQNHRQNRITALLSGEKQNDIREKKKTNG